MGEPARKINSDLRTHLVSQVEEDGKQYELATIKNRAIAFMIDMTITAAVSSVAKVLLGAVLHLKGQSSALFIVKESLGPLYFVFMQFNDGQTIGKKIMKIKVVPDSGSALLSFGQILGRETIGRLLSGALLLSGYITAARREDRKTYHDRIFSTRVIRLD